MINKKDYHINTYCRATFAFLAVVLIIVAVVRIRLLSLPFERDEGEYAYIGQLLLKGIPPFVHAYTMKLPGVSFMYALFMLLFGQTATAIHLGLLIVNAICIGLLYLLAVRLMQDKTAAVISSACYAIISLSGSVLGFVAHATHFVVLFVLPGMILLLNAIESRRITLFLASGLSFGLAFTMKQHAIFFAIFALIYFIWSGRIDIYKNKKYFLKAIVLFVAGMGIPYVIFVLWMVYVGAFDKFWFWTVQYAREYAATPSLFQGLKVFYSQMASVCTEQPYIWTCYIVGTLLATVVLLRRPANHNNRIFLLGFLVASCLSISPGFIFRDHYFVLVLPSMSLMVGFLVYSVSAKLETLQNVIMIHLKVVPLCILVAVIALGVFKERNYFFLYSPFEVSRDAYGSDPNIESIQIASYIKNRTSIEDKIAVIGSDPEIYFYAGRLSATGYIYMFGLEESQPYAKRMQIEMLYEIEYNYPKYVVVVGTSMAWLMQNAPVNVVTEWSNSFSQNYEIVGVIDIIDFYTTNYVWGPSARTYIPSSKAYLTVYRRMT